MIFINGGSFGGCRSHHVGGPCGECGGRCFRWRQLLQARNQRIAFKWQGGDSVERNVQCGEPFATSARNRYDRASKPAREFRRINARGARACHIPHIERHHRWMSVQQYLCCKLQVASEVGGIHDDQHGIRFNAIKRAAQAVATHARFGHIDRQRVGARKVNQLQFGTTIRRAMRADASFNGRPRKVCSASTHAA